MTGPSARGGVSAQGCCHWVLGAVNKCFLTAGHGACRRTAGITITTLTFTMMIVTTNDDDDNDDDYYSITTQLLLLPINTPPPPSVLFYSYSLLLLVLVLVLLHLQDY